jgi:hypothetical protein
MLKKIPITIEETNNEIIARIIKAAAQKFNCTMVIDFSNGNRKVEFVGDEAHKPQIVEELKSIFERESKK